MKKKVISIIGVILIVILAVGFVIEYRAVNTSIEHNLTVATGDILNVMDDAEKIGKREVLRIKRLETFVGDSSFRFGGVCPMAFSEFD